MSYSDKQTEKQLNSLERQLKKLYREAYREMSIEADDYFQSYEARWQNEYEAFMRGEYTEAEFKAWEQTQLARGKRWENVRDSMAKRMVNANQIASAYVNDATPSIYSLNANYEAFQILGETGNLETAWDMVDEEVIRTLLTSEENFTEFKTMSENPVRDYEWNSKQIQHTLNASILQGKDLKGITESFEQVMKRNHSSAVRNARTAFTSAQNAGKLSSMQKAQDMGIEVQKKWRSTHDERTRFSHALMDGETVGLNERFSNGLMHPADSDGAPSEVYNCRCTLLHYYPKYQKTATPDETYFEWAERHLNTTTAVKSKEEKKADEKVNKNLAKYKGGQ